jgi:hypothetical protein
MAVATQADIAIPGIDVFMVFNVAAPYWAILPSLSMLPAEQE